MRRKLHFRKIVLILTLSIGVGNAQKIIQENGLEYLQDKTQESINSVDRPSFVMNVKIKKVKHGTKDVLVKIENIYERKNEKVSLRYRKKRQSNLKDKK
ncbi:hypothetical protein [uncultured Tenacibaculum sp.]|uniref:hypothetical protein n=1 Tax=uncultured Tenacibaculum sp. TaxID=174713 RepID=UPI0026375938|nr:hypothetical protein [uncultured Tenacibaculum sp.]